jgi:hypothetical protein
MTNTKIVVNCETGETTVVTLTSEEIAQREADAALAALKTSARAKLVAGQALTEEEAATLVF